MGGLAGEIEHGLGGIEQSGMKAKARQAECGCARTAAKIEGAQRAEGLGQKFLQVGEGEVEAQAALGGFEVGGVLGGTGLEAVAIKVGGDFLHAHSGEMDPNPAEGLKSERISKGSGTTSRG